LGLSDILAYNKFNSRKASIFAISRICIDLHTIKIDKNKFLKIIKRMPTQPISGKKRKFTLEIPEWLQPPTKKPKLSK
jgi:hypothetical protein